MTKPKTISEYKTQQDRAHRLEVKAKAAVEEWIAENFEPSAVGATYKPLPGLPGHHIVSDDVDQLSVWYDVFGDRVMWT